MVTFIRGGPYFQSPRQIGQIYVKLLPNGEAVRLTNDPRPKFAPVFTPDGTRIAYSMIDDGSWDTWTVPVLGGQPARILPNASGLTWMTDGRVLFSEIKVRPAHGDRDRHGSPRRLARDLLSGARARHGALLLRVAGSQMGPHRRDGSRRRIYSAVPARAV